MDAETLFEIGLILVFFGFALAFISALLLMFGRGRTGSKLRGGGIIMLGPFPIVFGSDRSSVKGLMILAILLVILVLAFVSFVSLASR